MKNHDIGVDSTFPAGASHLRLPERGIAPATQRFWLVMSGIITVCIILISAYGRLLDRTLPKAQLPVPTQAYDDIVLTERNGRRVHLGDLRGKVIVLACLYTVCPHGCAAVVGQMQKLHREFGSRADFHLVSLAVAPERDTPAFLSTYATALGVKPADPWWFLTGDQKATWAFMTDSLKLEAPKPIPEDERVNPLDLYEHDLRIVLVDRHGRVRGYYAVFHPQPEIAGVFADRLHRDVRALLGSASD